MSNEKELIIEHPLEGVFDIEGNTTIMPVVERSTELVVAEEFDDKDKEIEGQFQEIYDAAMSAFDTQAMDSELIEPKFRARNQEVAVQFLNAALSAAKEKSSLKQHKDRLNVDKAKTGPKTLNQNLIVADRNDILKHLAGTSDEDDS